MTKTMKMTVLKGSSIGADSITIKVDNGDTAVFEKTYHYGYNVSWDRGFVTESKPLDKDLVESKAKEYGIELEDITRKEGENVFKGIMER